MKHQKAGKLPQAARLYREVLAKQPGHADALHLYGLVCLQSGDHESAVRYISKAVKRVPNHPVLRNNLGDAMRRAGNLAAAESQLLSALRLKPDYGNAHLNLVPVYLKTRELESAVRHGLDAVRLLPDRADAWYNLGLVYLDHVRLEDALEAFRRAVALRPAYAKAVTALCYTLNLVPGLKSADVAAEHCRAAAGLYGSPPSGDGNTANLPLRIGYVSGDFKAHAVTYFFEPILERHDKARFETFCYSDVDTPDVVTQRLKACSVHWRDTAEWDDEKLWRKIRSDKIDVLVDLAGYTLNSRLGVFARAAAPRQVSYLGYPGTTGLAAMNFRIVDAITAPEDESPVGSESLLRLPHVFACFRPPSHAPLLTSGPAASGGAITFGSFHKVLKINASVIETWAELLRRNPDSRLLLMRDELDGWQRRRLLSQFANLGIEADRLELRKFDESEGSFLEAFADIDIQLDTFPWSGHTMACMALWMGVPVVSLSGDSHAARMVASVLTAIDLTDLIADDLDSYVRIASKLASDRGRLTELRAGLREKMSQSPLLDETAFVRSFESAILQACGID